MWRRDVAGPDDDRGREPPVVVPGSPDLHGTFVRPSHGGSTRLRIRRPTSALGFARRLWRLRRGGPERTVTCIACGASVPRTEAREYDKLGDRWERDRKRFEHLCRDCDDAIDHRPRDGLESLLVDVGAGERSRAAFLAAFCERVEERAGEGDRPREDE